MANINQILKLQRQQLAALVEVRGVGRLRKLYAEAEAELAQQLRAIEKVGKGATFTAHHLRVMLLQVQSSVRQFEDSLGEQLTSTGELVAKMAPKHVIASVREMEKHFTGHTPVIQADQAAVFQKLYNETAPSLLDRFHRSKRFYGPPVVAKVRDSLSLALIKGEGVDQAVNRVVGTDGVFTNQRWRAERIVRTELSYAANFSSYKGLQHIQRTEQPALMKKLIETFDDRTGGDSKILHGQVRRIDEPFVYIPPAGKKGYAPFLMPPGRPNDRACVIPWKQGWAETQATEET